jgi:hypothetical protein
MRVRGMPASPSEEAKSIHECLGIGADDHLALDLKDLKHVATIEATADFWENKRSRLAAPVPAPQEHGRAFLP